MARWRRDPGLCGAIHLVRFSVYSAGNVQGSSEEESQDLPSKVLPSGLFVIHDATGSGHYDEAATNMV